MTTTQVIVGSGRFFFRWSLPTVALSVLSSVAMASPLPHVPPPGTNDTLALRPSNDDLAGSTAKANGDPTSIQDGPDAQQPKANGNEKETELTKPTDEKPSTKEARAAADDKLSKELTYEAQMAIAQAYKAVNDKAEAIAAYEKAILAAPNDDKKAAARNALEALTGLEDHSWLKPTISQLQSIWVWVALVPALWIPWILFRRLFRWLSNIRLIEKQFRVLVTSAGGGVETVHFCNLVQQAHDALQIQRLLIEQIGKQSAVTIYPSFRSHSLVAMLEMSLPTVVADKWWAPAIPSISNWLDPPNYSINMSIMPTKSWYGVYVCLTEHGDSARHWNRECSEGNLPVILADLAFEVIANINHRRKTGEYVY